MTIKQATKIYAIDSHTGGEPTRLVITGAPDLGEGDMAERREVFRNKYDHWRAGIVNEPRGSAEIVGALLCKPQNPSNTAGVVFFNNIGYLGMCGHGTIGLVSSLAYLGRITPGPHVIETPVGNVNTFLHDSGEVTVNNVASYRFKQGISVRAGEYGTISGDIAWGGNWFFLTADHGQQVDFQNIDGLTDCAENIRLALSAAGITGAKGQPIDHIELFGPPSTKAADSRNFVLCPGGAYDRSPCGTGTSAKLACLVADKKLAPGQIWRQESITGSIFEGHVRIEDGHIYPSIKGTAFVTGENTLVFNEADPFGFGIF